MALVTPCCLQTIPAKEGPHPFSRMVVLGFYDGPTSGLIQCQKCSAEFYFDMLNWDDDHEVRVFRLTPLPRGSLERVVRAWAEAGPPRWPVWVPQRNRLSSEEARHKVDQTLHEVLAQAGQPEHVLSWTGYADTILTIERVPSEELTDIPDWFSQEGKEHRREEALRRFLESAKASTFCSNGPYPSRNELHERR